MSCPFKCPYIIKSSQCIYIYICVCIRVSSMTQPHWPAGGPKSNLKGQRLTLTQSQPHVVSWLPSQANDIWVRGNQGGPQHPSCYCYYLMIKHLLSGPSWRRWMTRDQWIFYHPPLVKGHNSPSPVSMGKENKWLLINFSALIMISLIA